MPKGAVDAKAAGKRHTLELRKIEEWNIENKNKPACYKCAHMAVVNRGEKVRSVEEYRKGMHIVGASKMKLFQHKNDVIWGAMVDWECPLGHGTAISWDDEDLKEDETITSFVKEMKAKLRLKK